MRRYQHAVRPYSGRIHAALAVVLALIAASGTIGRVAELDPLHPRASVRGEGPPVRHGRGFFVFKLPFLEFLVNWILVVAGGDAAGHGGLPLPERRDPGPAARRPGSGRRSRCTSRCSWPWWPWSRRPATLQRYQLDTSTNGYVEGAGYTDVHARLPALELLFFVSLFAAAILLYNIRRQGWTLPVLAVGVWAFVALVIGVIYPAVLQALKVNPAQSTLEQPYITAQHRRHPGRLRRSNHVKTSTFAGQHLDLARHEVAANMTTLDNIRLWDPDPAISLPTFQKLQDIHVLLHVPGGRRVDRYTHRRHGAPGRGRGAPDQPRQTCPSTGWVNTHLQYTHGEGLVLAAANQADGRRATRCSPSRTCRRSRRTGLPEDHPARRLLRPQRPGLRGGRQPSSPSSTTSWPTGTDVETTTKGTGGRRARHLPHQGRLRRPPGRLQPPDLQPGHPQVAGSCSSATSRPWPRRRRRSCSFDADPVRRRWSTATSTGSSTPTRPPPSTPTRRTPAPSRPRRGAACPASYNYVRNSVKVVIDAYSGKMTFYAMDNDPILRAYEAAFPGMFTPTSQMSPHARGPPPLPRGHVRGAGRRLRPLPHHLAVELLHRRRRLEPLAHRRRRLAHKRPRRHRDHQRPGARDRGQPAADVAPVPGAPAARGARPVLHHLRRLRAGGAGLLDPEPLGLHHDQLGPGRVRASCAST